MTWRPRYKFKTRQKPGAAAPICMKVGLDDNFREAFLSRRPDRPPTDSQNRTVLGRSPLISAKAEMARGRVGFRGGPPDASFPPFNFINPGQMRRHLRRPGQIIGRNCLRPVRPSLCKERGCRRHIVPLHGHECIKKYVARRPNSVD